MAKKAATTQGVASMTVAQQLKDLGVRGVLRQIAERGQLIQLKCEMAYCYCPKGRGHFETKQHPPGPWIPTPDHYPTLRSDGGHLVPTNVRLAHLRCNQRDHGWRTKIRSLLSKGLTLQQIAELLNKQAIPRPHGHTKWSPALVRKAFVS